LAKKLHEKELLKETEDGKGGDRQGINSNDKAAGIISSENLF
jgi:hypothetical protein